MDAALVSPIPLEEFEASATDIDQALTLPPGAYTRADFHRFELAAVFDRSWLCVGRIDEIPEPGDYFTTTLPGGEKAIVARDKQRNVNVNVMSSVCQHRGMCVTAPAKRERDSWYAEPGEQRGTCRSTGRSWSRTSWRATTTTAQLR